MEWSVGDVGSCAAIVLVAASLVGCAARAPQDQRFIHRGTEAVADKQARDAAARTTNQALHPPKETLETYIEKARQLTAAARPRPQPVPETIEGQDAELSAARLMLALAPGAESHRRVAVAYMRVGVLDAAYDHFKAALRLEPTDAASFDGLARVWRDWGLPNLGLGDAHRAIYYAPSSPTVYNTLGTVLLKLGQTAAAQSAFEAALQRDPEAPYALSNLCYVKFLQGQGAQAIAACGSAVGLQPGLAAAHNNLGLAYWVEGDRLAATAAFASIGGPGAARYNTGIALLASRMFQQAAEAFDDASMLSPALGQARRRAVQARMLAAGAIDGPQ
jgi:tetratricopeptide (TPR) repeat protein